MMIAPTRNQLAWSGGVEGAAKEPADLGRLCIELLDEALGVVAVARQPRLEVVELA